MSETCPITTVRVNWTDPKTGDLLMVESSVHPGPHYDATMNIVALGCTSRAQVERLAKWCLNMGPEVKVSPMADPNLLVSIPAIIAEWRNGCSCAGDEKPEECPECTKAAMDAIERRVSDAIATAKVKA